MPAGLPKFGLAIVKDGFVFDNVVPITLATRSVLCRMLTAGVATLPRSGSVESVCNAVWQEDTLEDGWNYVWHLGKYVRTYFGNSGWTCIANYVHSASIGIYIQHRYIISIFSGYLGSSFKCRCISLIKDITQDITNGLQWEITDFTSQPLYMTLVCSNVNC